MLCLMTLADIEAVSPETLTPWKEELLWRLYVDTYNHLTQRYGDELIERNQAGPDELLGAAARRSARGRDHAVPRGAAAALPAAVPARRDLPARAAGARHQPGRSAPVARARATSVWTLAVVTLDKPFLFSNICGVLSSFGMNILRGHALTNPNGLVLDVFQFTDDERFLELNRRRARRRCSHVLEDVVSGRADVTDAAARPRAERPAAARHARGSRRSSAPTTRRRAATRSSTSSPTTRWGCCTASAASSRSTAATSTWC